MSKSIQLFVILLIFCIKIHSIYSIDNLFLSHQGNVYYIDNDQKYSWFDALTKCVSMNMTLATLDTKEKSDDITSLLKTTLGNVNPLWIGAVANGNDRLYAWISTGNKVTYTNWFEGEPDFYNNNEYCLQTGWSNKIQWNDHECHKQFGLICEHNQQYHLIEEIQRKLQKEVAKEQQLQTELDKNQLLLQLLLDYKKSHGNTDEGYHTNRNMFFNIN